MIHLLTPYSLDYRCCVKNLILPPKKNSILGADIAGYVESIGKNVSQFKVGDEVFGDVSESGFGGFAEYKCAKEHEIVLIPSNISFAEAAAMPLAALTALHALRDFGKINQKNKVLINGASGGVGNFVIQLAKYFEADVTAICSSSKIKLAKSIGADNVIDYTKEDFTQNTTKYDLVIAVNGFRSIFDYLKILKPQGIYIMIGGGSKQLFQALLLGPLLSLVTNKNIVVVTSKPNQKDLHFLVNLIESKKISPIIDRTYPLIQLPDAIRYMEEGHANGKVVISIY
jgi:NADPH:quinone reductase-like Zn-dependent oxidoreductase